MGMLRVGIDMKFLIAVMAFGVLVSGCYVRYPSVGVRSIQIRHIETCKRKLPAGKVECTHTRTWIK